MATAWDAGHHAPSTKSVVGASGFELSRRKSGLVLNVLDADVMSGSGLSGDVPPDLEIRRGRPGPLPPRCNMHSTL